MVIVVVVPVIVVVVVVMVVVVTGAVMTPEALAQSELGGQLPDGFSLIEDGLLLPYEALAQVQDGGFGFVGHHATPAGAAVVVSVPVTARSMGHVGRGVAAGVCLWGDGSANKLGANAVVMIHARQTAGCSGT